MNNIMPENHRGVEGRGQDCSMYEPRQEIENGTVKFISSTDGFGVITSKHVRVNDRWVEVDEIRHYTRLIRDIKCALTEKPERSLDEEELLQILKSI